MRPPMQTAALQQNENSRLHSQQQQTLQPQPAATVADLTFQNPRRISKLQQREIFVENKLNFACTALGATAPAADQRRRSSLQSYRQHFVRNSYDDQDLAADDDYNDDDDDEDANEDNNDDSIRLVDLSTSPPHATSGYVPPYTNTYQQQHSFAPTQHATFISDYTYSRSSSSDDNSLSGERFQRQQQQQQYRANTFDDAAENFIINFPADSSPAHHENRNDCVINLPLSETEPLLTNIEATVADTKRAIRLNKNSASLIFTKKEVPSSNNNAASLTTTAATTAANRQQTEQRQRQQHFHHSLRSSNDINSRKSRHSKHLPATYHQQQHRRSLQLNYNNNLVTTSTCSANNNYCGAAAVGSDAKCGSGAAGGGAVLHKPHQRQQQHHSGRTANSAANTTAAATRKQHAYSWYAPVYSALEEELEQDSRDSSPLHNLANTKKHHTNQHHIRTNHNSSTATDNETVALLETRNQINIQAQLHTQSNWENSSSSAAANGQTPQRKNAAVPNTLVLHNFNTAASSFSVGGTSESSSVATLSSYDAEGPLAGSLGLAGGPMPPRRRFENFLKSLVGLRPSSNARNGNSSGNSSNGGVGGSVHEPTTTTMQNRKHNLPSSPEITITRTPSEQNVVVLRDPSGRCQQQLANSNGAGSTSSLNVVQQKLWNIMRREGSATSLHQEKSQSIVQYTGLRKCETVLALTRQTNSLRSPVLGAGPGIIGGGNGSASRGSGIYNANGVEQIRPLNRLRNSVNSINATCSRCSSLLSLAASGSRYSLNVAANGGVGGFVNTAGKPPLPPLHQRHYSNASSSNVSWCNNRSPDSGDDNNLGAAAIGGAAGVVVRSTSGNCSRKSSNGANSTHSVSSLSPPSNVTTATLDSSFIASACTSPNTPTPTPLVTPTNHSVDKTKTTTINCAANATDLSIVCGGTTNANNSTTTTATAYALTVSTLPSLSTNSASTMARDLRDGSATVNPMNTLTTAAKQPTTATLAQQIPSSAVPFQMFTCKLCLVDVESASEATILLQCGCQFCTECMKAYVEFEISEGAYEISCPDAQCPTQGAVTIPEIASLTTANLMKKHHRYRLNREIELDKSRTWCPRAGCETVCQVGLGEATALTPNNASTSTAATITTTTTTAKIGLTISPAAAAAAAGGGGVVGDAANLATLPLCAVQCPSCKDEFCSACKKTWHAGISCEEHSRRLVADGQDDIGIPFDNDLIKCCPMCAVPIEKDEGCAQMMCKRCKHVFCWYCLASLDDDFLLRHYDKGPCKNKLGHSRASVVWHRAQVIGIFAGFGILLLVASPLLLLAAPCIICCKCRSCSGSKIDEGDGDLDEAAALQS